MPILYKTKTRLFDHKNEEMGIEENREWGNATLDLLEISSVFEETEGEEKGCAGVLFKNGKDWILKDKYSDFIDLWETMTAKIEI